MGFKMNILFIIDDEVHRRSIMPVFRLFVNNGYYCKILLNAYASHFLLKHSQYFVDSSDAVNQEWKYIISSNPIKKGIFKGLRVSIPHGSMFGNSSWSLMRALNSDIYFGLSPHELPYIKYYLKENFIEDSFIASGNPALDEYLPFLNNSHEQKIKVRNSLGLTSKKVILLTSHWTSVSNFRKFGTGLLDAIKWNFPKHQILCTCHPKLLNSPKSEFLYSQNTKTPYFDSKWLVQSIKKIEDSQVKVFLGSDPTALLFSSDIFVGDNSSILAQASFFGIPLIVQNEGTYFSKKIEDRIKSDVYQFKNIEQLIQSIALADVHEKNRREKTGEKIKELFIFNVGSAAKAIFESLKNL